LGRALPLLALVAALLGAWLAPPPAAMGAGSGNIPALDTVDGADRAAVKPKPPAQLQAAAKRKHLAPQSGPSPDVIQAAADRIDYGNRDVRRDRIAFKIVLPKPAALVAQPRAPPIQQDLTPAV
jgi:hypothetical protein